MFVPRNMDKEKDVRYGTHRCTIAEASQPATHSLQSGHSLHDALHTCTKFATFFVILQIRDSSLKHFAV